MRPPEWRPQLASVSLGMNAIPIDGPWDVHVVDITSPDAVGSVAAILDDVRPALVLELCGPHASWPGRVCYRCDVCRQHARRRPPACGGRFLRSAPRVVHLSTAAVYGRDPGSDVAEDSPTDAVGHYARSKLMGDMVCHTFAQSDGVDVVIARPFNVLGPGEPVGSIVSDLATQVLAVPPGATAQASLRETASTRDFLDVRDVADALLVLAEKGTSGEAYNVCSGAATSVSDLVCSCRLGLGSGNRSRGGAARSDGDPLDRGPGQAQRTGLEPHRDLRTSLQDISAEFGRS